MHELNESLISNINTGPFENLRSFLARRGAAVVLSGSVAGSVDADTGGTDLDVLVLMPPTEISHSAGPPTALRLFQPTSMALDPREHIRCAGSIHKCDSWVYSELKGWIDKYCRRFNVVTSPIVDNMCVVLVSNRVRLEIFPAIPFEDKFAIPHGYERPDLWQVAYPHNQVENIRELERRCPGVRNVIRALKIIWYSERSIITSFGIVCALWTKRRSLENRWSHTTNTAVTMDRLRCAVNVVCKALPDGVPHMFHRETHVVKPQCREAVDHLRWVFQNMLP